jgi:hypothetical protein
MVAKTVRFDDCGSPAYRVVLPDGAIIGTIRRGWFRVGGWGWTYTGYGGHPTIKDAARQCESRYWGSVARQADGMKLCE